MKTTTAIILLLISVGLFYTFITPEYGKVQALEGQASHYKQVLGNVSDLTEKRNELTLSYQGLPKQDVSNLKKILPDNVNTVELALNLDAIAGQNGITIKGINILQDKNDNSATIIKTASNKPYDKVQVSFSFVSSYEGFRKFLAGLEASLRIIEVKSISFTTTDSGLNEYHMQIETYWLK